MITAEQMREQLGLDPDDAGQDELLETLIRQAREYGRTYCRLRPEEDVPEFLLSRMVAEDYNRLGGSGLSSRTVSGASEHYLAGYSDDVTAILRSLRHFPDPGRRCGC